MMGTEEALMAEITRTNGMESTPKLVLADWCQENDKGDLAYALRWCVSKNKWPYFRPQIKRRPYEWTREQKRYLVSKQEIKSRSSSMLHQALYDVGVGGWCHPIPWAYAYPSWQEAVKYLGMRLVVIKEIYEIDELPERVVVQNAVNLVVCQLCGMARNAALEECAVCANGKSR